MAALTRLELVNNINWRVANEDRSAASQFWSKADVNKAITAAITKAAPLGDPQTVEMSYAQYNATPQTPAIDVVSIKRITVRTTDATGHHKIAPSLYELHRYATDGKWLSLVNDMAANETLRIQCLVAYALNEADATLVTADYELIYNYAVAALYQRYIQNGQIEGPQNESQLMLMYEQKGDIRRQELMFVQYPPVVPFDAGPAKK